MNVIITILPEELLRAGPGCIANGSRFTMEGVILRSLKDEAQMLPPAVTSDHALQHKKIILTSIYVTFSHYYIGLNHFLDQFIKFSNRATKYLTGHLVNELISGR